MIRNTLLYILLLTLPFAASGQTADLSKLSGQLRELVAKPQPLCGRAVDGRTHEPVVCAFVRTASGGTAAVESHGGRVLATFGDICIADMPLSAVSGLSLDRRVSRIEAQRGSMPALDSVYIQIGAADAYAARRLPQAFDGAGVMVGVQDVGFDMTHPTFRDAATGRLRIRGLWDQLSADTADSAMPVGAAYEGEDALMAYAHTRDAAMIYHGTHTAGIAAGGGCGTRYRGIAFASDICLVGNAVTTNAALIDSADLYKYTYAMDALGFKYIFDHAAAEGKPCVINFSEGSTQDFRGDDVLYYEVLSRMCGPGRIIVASAGNNGLETNYFRKPRGTASAGVFVKRWAQSLAFMLKSESDFGIRFKAYGPTPYVLTLPTTLVKESPDSTYAAHLDIYGTGYDLTVTAVTSCYDRDETAYEVSLSGPTRIGWWLPMSFEVTGEAADVEFYNVNSTVYESDRDPSLTCGDNTHSVISPASAPCVIGVGATAYRTHYTNIRGETVTYDTGTGGAVGDYSSRGPTLDGRVKPEVVAPGTNIISAYSSYHLETLDELPEEVVATFEHDGRRYGWISGSGTSMSSPAVAGAIALWLQANPQLSPDGVREVLKASSTRRGGAQGDFDCEQGYGEINVYKGLLHILGIDGLPGISDHQPDKAAVSVADGHVVVSLDAPSRSRFTVRVYGCDGSLVAAADFPEGTDRAVLPVSAAHHGVYVVQLSSGDKAVCGSSLVRL